MKPLHRLLRFMGAKRPEHVGRRSPSEDAAGGRLSGARDQNKDERLVAPSQEGVDLGLPFWGFEKLGQFPAPNGCFASAADIARGAVAFRRRPGLR